MAIEATKDIRKYERIKEGFGFLAWMEKLNHNHDRKPSGMGGWWRPANQRAWSQIVSLAEKEWAGQTSQWIHPMSAALFLLAEIKEVCAVIY